MDSSILLSPIEKNYQEVTFFDAWTYHSLTVSQLKKMFTTKTIVIPNHRTNYNIYYKKDEKGKKGNVCLFHGTTEDRIHEFDLRGGTYYKLFLTFDLDEAIRYANDRAKSRRSRPVVLVFEFYEPRYRQLLQKARQGNFGNLIIDNDQAHSILNACTTHCIKILPSQSSQSFQQKKSSCSVM